MHTGTCFHIYIYMCVCVRVCVCVCVLFIIMLTIIFIGSCFDEASVKFIKTPARNSYPLVGYDKVLSFQFKYVGHCIKPFVLVGTVHLINDHSINYTHHHGIHHESGVEDYNITLLNVSHIYGNNYTVYASTTGIFNKTDQRYSFYLCKLVNVCT